MRVWIAKGPASELELWHRQHQWLNRRQEDQQQPKRKRVLDRKIFQQSKWIVSHTDSEHISSSSVPCFLAHSTTYYYYFHHPPPPSPVEWNCYCYVVGDVVAWSWRRSNIWFSILFPFAVATAIAIVAAYVMCPTPTIINRDRFFIVLVKLPCLLPKELSFDCSVSPLCLSKQFLPLLRHNNKGTEDLEKKFMKTAKNEINLGGMEDNQQRSLCAYHSRILLLFAWDYLIDITCDMCINQICAQIWDSPFVRVYLICGMCQPILPPECLQCWLVAFWWEDGRAQGSLQLFQGMHLK